MPQLPQNMIHDLTQNYGLTTKDAVTLLSLDDGDRLDYFFSALTELQESNLDHMDSFHLGKVAGNWYSTSVRIWLPSANRT